MQFLDRDFIVRTVSGAYEVLFDDSDDKEQIQIDEHRIDATIAEKAVRYLDI